VAGGTAVKTTDFLPAQRRSNMTTARLDMAGLSLEWLQTQVPGGSPAELVDFALQHAVKYVPNPSPHRQRLRDKAWYDESKAMALKIVAGQVPELAEECERQVKALGF
jgi:hypothetical protein